MIGVLVNATLAKMEGRSFLVMVWPLIAIALLLGANYGHEIRIITSAIVGELMKSKAETEGVWFAKTKSGKFTPRAVIDGAVVDFVVDMDAPDIVLTPEAARSIGLDPSTLTFDQQTGMAGEMEAAANVRLRTFQLGSRMMQDLPAKVSATGKSGNVLGKAFFDRVSSWTIKHDTLMVLP